MKLKVLFLTLLCAAFGGSLFAQNPAAVTGTILDPNSVPYYPAQVTACLTPNTLDPTVGGKHVNNNIGANYCVGAVSTAADGSFSMPLFANGNISPAATQWIFTVQTVGAAPPAGKGSQSFTTAAVTISGASQSVTSNFTGLPALLNSGSGSSSASPCAPSSPACFNLGSTTSGSFFDTKFVGDASWTSGVASGITSPSAAFTSADVGKTIFGFNGCNPASAGGTELATLGAASQTTILSVQSGTSVTISAAPTSTPVGIGCLVYGHMDDAGIAAVEALGALSPTCPVYGVPPAYGMISQPHFFTNPSACQALPQFISGVALWGQGVVYRGFGPSVSQVFLVPWFDMTKCTRGVSTVACFLWVQQGLYENFGISGVVNTRNGSTSGKKLSESAGYVLLRKLLLQGFGAADADLDGIFNNCGSCNAGGPIKLENSTVQAWGNHSVHNVTANFFATGTAFQTSQALDGNGLLLDGGSFQSQGGNAFMGGFGVTGQSYIRVNGGVAYLQGDVCRTDVSTAQNFCVRAAGGVTHLEEMDLSVTGNVGSAGIFCSGSGAVVNVSKSLWQGVTGANLFSNAGCIVNELGGNTFGGSAASTYNGVLNSDGRQLKAACTGVVTASLTTGGIYGTGPNIAATACNASPNNAAPGTLGVGVPMQGARTVYALQVTATAAGTNASSGVVTVMKNGVATTITCTVGTATSCVDSTHNVAFADGDLISFQYTTQAADTLAGLKIVVHWL